MADVSVEIISIGTEILLGEITDTNSVHIARQLRDIGLNVYHMTSVGDNEQRITDSIRLALSRADVVITTGGLGPTVDDMTRQGVAAATEGRLVFHQELLDKIAERFTGFRAQMTDNNRQQAYLPADAILIENPVGTAPCFIVEQGKGAIISLPGVPREMKYLLIEQVIPYLRKRYQLGGNIIKARILRTAGIGESALDNLIGAPLLTQTNPTVGLAAHSGQVDVRITAKADNLEYANKMIAGVESRLREQIGNYVYGTDNDRIEDVLTDLLAESHLQLAISETGNGGVVSTRIKQARRGAEVLTAIQVYDTPDELQRALSEHVPGELRALAEVAAKAACRGAQARVGIAIVSQPDMDDHHSDSEDGTAIAVHTETKTLSRVYGFGGRSEITATWAGTWALSMAWRLLHDQLTPQ